MEVPVYITKMLLVLSISKNFTEGGMERGQEEVIVPCHLGHTFRVLVLNNPVLIFPDG